MIVSLNGLNKADVLAALYNASRPQGMGFMSYKPEPMTHEQAAEILAEILETGATYFDYLQGRVMKVDLSGDELDVLGFTTAIMERVRQSVQSQHCVLLVLTLLRSLLLTKRERLKLPSWRAKLWKQRHPRCKERECIRLLLASPI